MRKRALLIGVNGYDTLGKLRYAQQDAAAFADALRQYCGFDDTEVTLLTCEAPGTRRATQRYIELALESLRQSRDLDLLVFGFWGHGFLDELNHKQRYLCGIDTLEKDLPGTSVHIDTVKSRLSQVSAENTLIVLDCCQERAVSRGAAGVTVTEDEVAALAGLARDIQVVQRRERRVSLPTVAVLNACREGQKAYEWDERGHGIFTAHLLEAFAEGHKSLAPLAYAVSRRVVKTAQDLSHDQCPFITIEGGADIPLVQASSNVSFAPPPIRTETKWFYAEDDREVGPVSEEELLARINAETEVWRPGLDGWTTAGNVPELRGNVRPPQCLAPEIIVPPKRIQTPQDLKPGTPRTVAGIEMVWIPPRDFMMGSPSNEKDQNRAEGPHHRVTISRGFWLGKYPVMQLQWEAVMGNNPSHLWGDGRLPVEEVSWDDCQTFCRELTQQGQGRFRLPTEAEWEYACRAGTKTPFYFGETISTNQANYDGNYTYGNGREGVYREETTPVDSFSSNAWGLHDMHGNVWEWCEDDWHDDYVGAPTDGRAWVGSPRATGRVIRGGGWNSRPGGCRSARRNWLTPEVRSNNLGFRLALPAVQ